MVQAKIALVDDEAPVRKALLRLLRLADYEVMPFASGEDFIAVVEECKPDCAVLDVHMPGLTGFQVRQQLLSARRHVPVIFITADESAAVDCEAGDSTVLHKPFARDELLAAIAAALQGTNKPP
jgi:FixJ family two-component response regulator